MFTESPSRCGGSLEQDLTAARPAREDGYRLETHEPNCARRASVERFIQQGFKRQHGAQVRSFMPNLLALRDPDGGICAVAGYRSAFDHLLYLEDYLDAPVELALAAKTGRTVARRAIVEIGNFAARHPEYARQLMRRLPAYLLERGHSWIVFTATRTVRRLLGELGAHPLELCEARAERIEGATREWGRYYKTDPRVMAGHLPSGLELEAFRPEVGY